MTDNATEAEAEGARSNGKGAGAPSPRSSTRGGGDHACENRRGVVAPPLAPQYPHKLNLKPGFKPVCLSNLSAGREIASSLPAHDSPRMTLVAKRNAQQAKQKADREAAPKPPAPKPPARTPAPQPNLTVLWSCSSVCFHHPLDSGQFFQIPISFRVLQGACGRQKCQGPPDSYHHWKSKALGRCISTCNEVHAKAEEKGHTGHRAKKGVAAAVQNKGMHGFCCSASGKSSVMEALTGVALPRASGTCTRCAFEISTKRELGRRASL